MPVSIVASFSLLPKGLQDRSALLEAASLSGLLKIFAADLCNAQGLGGSHGGANCCEVPRYIVRDEAWPGESADAILGDAAIPAGKRRVEQVRAIDARCRASGRSRMFDLPPAHHLRIEPECMMRVWPQRRAAIENEKASVRAHTAIGCDR